MTPSSQVVHGMSHLPSLIAYSPFNQVDFTKYIVFCFTIHMPHSSLSFPQFIHIIIPYHSCRSPRLSPLTLSYVYEFSPLFLTAIAIAHRTPYIQIISFMLVFFALAAFSNAFLRPMAIANMICMETCLDDLALARVLWSDIHVR